MEPFSIFYESAYVYKVPEDRGYLMFDFYLLSYLNSLVAEKEQKVAGGVTVKGPDKHQVSLSEDDISIVEHSYETLVEFLRKHMLKGIYYTIVREFTHVGNPIAWGRRRDKQLRGSFHQYFNIFGKDWERILKSIVKMRGGSEFLGLGDGANSTIQSPGIARSVIKTADNMNISPSEVVRVAKHVFNDFHWDPVYGGPSWAEIAEGWLMLYRAKTLEQKAVAIDHLYDLQHNSGSVLTKMKKYGGEGGYDWIQNALDFKRNIKDFSEILPHISPGLKKHAIRVLHKVEGPKPRASRNDFRILRKRYFDVFSSRGYKIYTTNWSDKFSSPEYISDGIYTLFKIRGTQLHENITRRVMEYLEQSFPKEITQTLVDYISEKVENEYLSSKIDLSPTFRQYEQHEPEQEPEWFAYVNTSFRASITLAEKAALKGGGFNITPKQIHDMALDRPWTISISTKAGNIKNDDIIYSKTFQQLNKEKAIDAAIEKIERGLPEFETGDHFEITSYY